MVAASQSTSAVTRSPSTSMLWRPKSPCRRQSRSAGTTSATWSSSQCRARGTAALGGPLSSLMRAAIPSTAADDAASVVTRRRRCRGVVRRVRRAAGSGGGPRPAASWTPSARRCSVGAARSGKNSPALRPRTRSITSRVPSPVAVAQPVFTSSAKNGSGHGHAPVVVHGLEDRELVRRRVSEQADRPILAHDHLGREARRCPRARQGWSPWIARRERPAPPSPSSSGEARERRRRYAVSCSAVTEHSMRRGPGVRLGPLGHGRAAARRPVRGSGARRPPGRRQHVGAAAGSLPARSRRPRRRPVGAAHRIARA